MREAGKQNENLTSIQRGCRGNEKYELTVVCEQGMDGHEGEVEVDA